MRKQGPQTNLRRDRTRARIPTGWAWIALIMTTSTAAYAQPPACVVDVESGIRLATADSVRRALRAIDRDRARVVRNYGPEEGLNGANIFGGHGGIDRDLCVPGRGKTYSMSSGVWGGEAHATAGPLGVRALVLGARTSADSWDSDQVEPAYMHTGYGGFLGYEDILEIGVLRFVQSSATVPGEADGWLVSAASHGFRTTVLLGDDTDSLDAFGAGLTPIPIGPVDLGGGLRYLRGEGVLTGYVEAEDFVLVGDRGAGIFLDARVEMELNTGRMRSGQTVLHLTFDTAPAENDPNFDASSGFAPDTVRVVGDLRAMLSFFSGSRLPTAGVVPGGGLAWEMGMYGRNVGFLCEAQLWLNEPLAMDYAPDPYESVSASLLARMRIDL